MSGKRLEQVRVKNFGPIKDVNLELGDFNVIIGPQATGKSIFLQILKLFQDAGEIKENFKNHNVEVSKLSNNDFLDLYFGNNMHSAMSKKSKFYLEGKQVLFNKIIRQNNLDKFENYFIPAHRGMSLTDGYISQFWDKTDYPYVMKEFTDTTRNILKSSGNIFPNDSKLIAELRDLINQYIYRNSTLKKSEGIINKINLTPKGYKGKEGLPIPVWSAGQREFFPLLVGLYALLPAGKTQRKDDVLTAIIEEPEMGLHPSAVVAVMLVILSLLTRDYQVILSTHSPVVLDIIWGIRKLKDMDGSYSDFKKMFDLPNNQKFEKLFKKLKGKKVELKSFLFQPTDKGTISKDISDLDPGSADDVIAKWGGLVDFTDRISDVVRRMGFRS